MIGVTYIHLSLIHPSITYPTRRLRDICFYRKITQKGHKYGRKCITDVTNVNSSELILNIQKWVFSNNLHLSMGVVLLSLDPYLI